MDRLIYTALTGLSARSRSQAVTANNLANAATTGFRREIIAAEGRYLSSPAAASRVQSGAPSVTSPQAPGKIMVTGRPLDLSMAGDAWLAVQGPGATEAYTRRGDLSISATGILQTGDGRAVHGESGTPITMPAGAGLDIAPDGSLSARSGDSIVALGTLKLVDGSALRGLDKRPDGQFATAEPLPVDPSARITIGTLESSNVETAGALVDLVEQSRGFEVNARLLGIAKDIDERTSRLMALDAQ